MTIINENSDFLFLYEAILSNPNGDPDQENRPRMDYDTKTNLVTDVRLKRFIRDYLSDKGLEIFVDMESDAKVSMETKMKAEINKILSNEENIELIFKDKPEVKKNFYELFPEDGNLFNKENPIDIYKKVKEDKKLAEFLLSKLVNLFFIDIRMFGSAFAIESFKKAFTGPIQINWGYSLHPVELVKSDSIVTIMNDEESTFGKDYRLYYSLIAFNGTINKNAAKTTGLTEKDRETFRDAIWNAIPANPTRSKVNQYPKLYVEIIYNDEYSNGYFGDLRNHIEVKPKMEHIRKLDDLEVNLDRLKVLLENNKGDKKPIKNYFIKSASDINFKVNN